mmetsp:Transcript_24035/g.55852  ORF Transcript_24035/g.55852 Transcript_24035/m.55852 type:complete len:97 (+) Transcript_24035:67-357(+)
MNSCRSLSLVTVAVFLSTASTVVLWSSAALTIFDIAAPLAAGILDSHGFSREAAEGLGRRLQYVLTDEGEMFRRSNTTASSRAVSLVVMTVVCRTY